MNKSGLGQCKKDVEQQFNNLLFKNTKPKTCPTEGIYMSRPEYNRINDPDLALVEQYTTPSR